jgi:hypothetical protein
VNIAHFLFSRISLVVCGVFGFFFCTEF